MRQVWCLRFALNASLCQPYTPEVGSCLTLTSRMSSGSHNTVQDEAETQT